MQNHNKKEMILDAMQELMGSSNVQAISVSDIAQKAGIGKGSIYYYFSSKNDIIDAVIERNYSRVLDKGRELAASSRLDAFQKLEIIYHACLDSSMELRRREEIRTFNEQQESAFIHQKFSRIIITKLKPILADIIRQGVREGSIQCSFPEETAQIVLTVLTITLSYSLTGSALTEAKAAFETAAAGMLEGIDGGMPEAERERLLHDRLVQAVSYDTGLDKPNIYNAYGAIVDRVAVCEGYARAMQYLLYQAGIQCLMATGSSKGETHAWNVVRIDGAYYHLDPTWDDPVGQTGFDFISYAYFNLTDEEIRRDHEIDAEGGYPLPACTDTAAHYYRSRGLVYTSYSAADVAALIREAREQGLTLVRLWVDGDADAYSRFILDDWDAICRQAGYQGGIRLIPPNTSEILFSLS